MMNSKKSSEKKRRDSDGEFFTKKIPAMILARLAFKDLKDQGRDPKSLKIMDPACGDGRLLSAAVDELTRLSKEEISDEEGNHDPKELNEIRNHIVENSIFGIDINDHSVKGAIANLSENPLGIDPGPDPKKIHIYKFPHGPQPDGSVRCGALELLNSKGDPDDLK